MADQDQELLKQLRDNGFISESEFQARMRGSSPPSKTPPKRANRGALNLSALSLELPPAEEGLSSLTLVPVSAARPLTGSQDMPYAILSFSPFSPILTRRTPVVNAVEFERRRTRSGGPNPDTSTGVPPKFVQPSSPNRVPSAGQSNIPAVEGFLKALGMSALLPVFLTHGFNNFDRLKALKESDLTTLQITNMVVMLH